MSEMRKWQSDFYCRDCISPIAPPTITPKPPTKAPIIARVAPPRKRVVEEELIPEIVAARAAEIYGKKEKRTLTKILSIIKGLLHKKPEKKFEIK